MSTIAIVPDARVTSKMITSVEVARRLVRSGHTVVLLGDVSADTVDPALSFRTCPIDLPSHDPARGIAAKLRRTASLLVAGRRLRREAIEQVDTSGFTTAAEELDPDLVLIDVEAHAYVIASVGAGYPVALLSVFYNLWKAPDIPPLHTTIVPGVGWRGSRVGIEWSWIRFRIWKRRRRMYRWLLVGGFDDASTLRDLARRLGVALDEIIDTSQWTIPWVYRLPTLSLVPPSLEFVGAGHAGTTFVGAMISTDRSHVSEARGADDGDTMERLRGRHGSAPIVYCSFGSYFEGDDLAFWHRLVDMARARPQWTVVLALGARIDPSRLEPLPDNVLCFSWAPQLELLALANCAVIHGGMTTVHECLALGVPMLVYPFAVNDQGGTAARVVYHGVGSMGDRGSDSAATIADRIDELMDSQPVAAQVAAVASAMAQDEERGALSSAVDQLIQRAK